MLLAETGKTALTRYRSAVRNRLGLPYFREGKYLQYKEIFLSSVCTYQFSTSQPAVGFSDFIISEYKMREKVERLFQGDMETDDCSELHGITLFCNLLVWL